MGYKQEELEVHFTDLLKVMTISPYCLKSRSYSCRVSSDGDSDSLQSALYLVICYQTQLGQQAHSSQTSGQIRAPAPQGTEYGLT